MLEGTTWDPEGEPTRAGSAERPVVSSDFVALLFDRTDCFSLPRNSGEGWGGVRRKNRSRFQVVNRRPRMPYIDEMTDALVKVVSTACGGHETAFAAMQPIVSSGR